MQAHLHLRREHVTPLALVLLLVWTISGVSCTTRDQSDAAEESLFGPGISGPVALVGTRIIDLDSGVISADNDILIDDGVIADIRPTGSVDIPAQFHQFDANGAYVIPGLWDMHTHIRNDEEFDTFVPLLIAHGVLGLRDVGGFYPDEFEERLSRLPHAPKVFAFAAVDQMLRSSAGTPRQARERVATLAARHVDFIKVQSNVSSDSFFAILDEAKIHGLSVVGHTPYAVSVSDASNAGLRTMEHLLEVYVETSSQADKIRSDRVTFSVRDDVSPGESMLELAYPDLQPMLDTWSEERERELFNTLIRNQTWQVPTLVLFRVWSKMHVPEFWDDPALEYVPASWRATWTPETHKRYSQLPLDDLDLVSGRIRANSDAQIELTGRMHAAGVPILAGTDSSQWNFLVPGQSLHEELEMFVQAGMTPLESLRTATISPIEYLGLVDHSGAVELGKLANLVLLEENPLEDIRKARNIKAVVLEGTLLDRDYLDALLRDVRQRSNP